MGEGNQSKERNNGLRISESEIKLYVENIKSDKNDLDSIIVRKYSIERFEFDLKEEEKTTEVVEIIDEFYLRVYALHFGANAPPLAANPEPASRTFELGDLELILDLKLIKKDIVGTNILTDLWDSDELVNNKWTELKNKWSAVLDKDDFKLQHIERPLFYINRVNGHYCGTTEQGSEIGFHFYEYQLIEGTYIYDPFTGYYEFDYDNPDPYDFVDEFYFDGDIQFSYQKLKEVFELTELDAVDAPHYVHSEFHDDKTGDVLSEEQSLLAWKKLKDSFTDELSSRDQIEYDED